MAVDIFAKIGDIKGESLDNKHKDEVEVLSWSWGVSQSGTLSPAAASVRARRTSTISTSRITSTRRRRVC